MKSNYSKIQTERLVDDQHLITNPPVLSSFLQINEIRRQRRKERFSDNQWDCAEKQIKEILIYLYENEISKSYQSYTKALFDNITKLTESFLYQDTSVEACEYIELCPLYYD